jgi:hypothetical protein
LGGPEKVLQLSRVVAALCLILATWVDTFGVAVRDFTFPFLESQPATITRAVISTEFYSVIVKNKSPKTIREIKFWFTGPVCTPPYKRVWPAETRGGLDIPAGTKSSIFLPKAVIDQVVEESMKSCGRATPIGIHVARVRFADESVWDIGDRLKAGEPYVDE